MVEINPNTSSPYSEHLGSPVAEDDYKGLHSHPDLITGVFYPDDLETVTNETDEKKEKDFSIDQLSR